MTPDVPTLTVAIPTYRRPDALAACLDAVLVQTREAHAAGLADVAEVLVVDNDPDASARDVAASHGDEVRHVPERTPGIAAVRARAMSETQTTLVAFLDDDEIPTAGWLSALLATRRDTGANAVVGRVVSVVEGPAHPWITAGDLFAGPAERPTGTVVPIAAAGNLLVDAAWARAHEVSFDTRLGLAGGEDTLFSYALTAAGGSIVWCNESLATERVPPERLNRRWLIRRFFSQGHATVAIDLLAAASPLGRSRVRFRGVVGGAARTTAGTLRFLAGVARRRDRDLARGLRLMCRGAGMAWAAVGAGHDEYARSSTT